MPRIINTYRQGAGRMADVMRELSGAFAGDTLTPALKRQQLLKAERENVETQNLADLYREPGYNRNQALATATLAGNTDYANAALFDSGFNADIGEVDRARRAAGMAESSTASDRDLMRAQDMYQWENKPVEVLRAGKPGFAPQGDLSRSPQYSPILSNAERQGTITQNFEPTREEQARILGADAGSDRKPFNYIKDGKVYLTTDGRTDVNGDPLPPNGYIGSVEGGAEGVGLTNSVQTDLQSDNVAYQKFNALIDIAKPLTADPSLFGPVGLVRGKAQELFQALNGVEALTQTRTELQSSLGERAQQLVPELYDPRLSEVDALWGILLYQGAAALAGQENRSVSDKDIQFMRQILGNPKGLFSSGASMATKLEAAQKVIDAYSNVNRRVATEGANPPEPAAGGDVVDWRDYFQGAN